MRVVRELPKEEGTMTAISRALLCLSLPLVAIIPSQPANAVADVGPGKS